MKTNACRAEGGRLIMRRAQDGMTWATIVRHQDTNCNRSRRVADNIAAGATAILQAGVGLITQCRRAASCNVPMVAGLPCVTAMLIAAVGVNVEMLEHVMPFVLLVENHVLTAATGRFKAPTAMDDMRHATAPTSAARPASRLDFLAARSNATWIRIRILAKSTRADALAVVEAVGVLIAPTEAATAAKRAAAAARIATRVLRGAATEHATGTRSAPPAARTAHALTGRLLTAR